MNNILSFGNNLMTQTLEKRRQTQELEAESSSLKKSGGLEEVKQPTGVLRNTLIGSGIGALTGAGMGFPFSKVKANDEEIRKELVDKLNSILDSGDGDEKQALKEFLGNNTVNIIKKEEEIQNVAPFNVDQEKATEKFNKAKEVLDNCSTTREEKQASIEALFNGRNSVTGDLDEKSKKMRAIFDFAEDGNIEIDKIDEKWGDLTAFSREVLTLEDISRQQEEIKSKMNELYNAAKVADSKAPPGTYSFFSSVSRIHSSDLRREGGVQSTDFYLILSRRLLIRKL